jgi:hypothetical protein
MATARATRFFAALATYRLGAEAAGIRTPLLITEADGELRWPGQARELFRSPAGTEGARFDWLDGYLT